MDHNVYGITEFARKASVSVRTLRYYDKKGLLSPSHYDEKGYKLYTDEDFISLQSILSLKFLGFSLAEIRDVLQEDKQRLQKRLQKQKGMMMSKRAHIDQILEAIERVENSLQTEQLNMDTMTELIRVTQMDLKPEWVNKYLDTEERKTMRDLAKQSYSKSALKKLAERGWTEENHQQHLQDYKLFRSELQRLTAEGYTPDSKEAQELAALLMKINKRYSENDPDIKEGMKKSWEALNALPEEKRPKTYSIPDKERAFIKEASIIYHRNHR